jgi:hypothetical protein
MHCSGTRARAGATRDATPAPAALQSDSDVQHTKNSLKIARNQTVFYFSNSDYLYSSVYNEVSVKSLQIPGEFSQPEGFVLVSRKKKNNSP